MTREDVKLNGTWGHLVSFLTIIFVIVGAVWALEASISKVGEDGDIARQQLSEHWEASQQQMLQQWQTTQLRSEARLAAIEALEPGQEDFRKGVIQELQGIHSEITALRVDLATLAGVRSSRR